MPMDILSVAHALYSSNPNGTMLHCMICDSIAQIAIVMQVYAANELKL